MNNDLIFGPIRAMAPVIAGLLTSKGMDSDTSGFIAAAIVAVLCAAWSYFSNRPAALVTKASQVEGVQVVVSPEAPMAVKAVAADPKVPDVKVAAP